MFAGDMFLPAALMISSFLRSMIVRKPCVVDAADVAGAQPAVGVDRVGRLPRLVAVARHHGAAADQQLAVRRPAAPPRRRSAGPPCRADRVLGHDRRDAAQLRHAPDLPDRDPDRGEELEHLQRRRRRSGHVRQSQRSSPSLDRSGFEHRCLGALVGLRQRRGHGLAGLLEHAPCRIPSSTASAIAARLASSGSAAIPASSAALSFSHTRGTAPNRVGSSVGDVREHLRDLGTAGDRRPPHHLAVVGEPAVGDVRHRQERDDRGVVGRNGHRLVQAAALGQLVGVGQLYALGRTGGARGVDQRQHVIGPDRLPRGLEIEVRRPAGPTRARRA